VNSLPKTITELFIINGHYFTELGTASGRPMRPASARLSPSRWRCLLQWLSFHWFDCSMEMLASLS